MVALTPPLMAIFNVVHVSGRHWLIMIGLSLAQLGAGEVLKLILRRRRV